MARAWWTSCRGGSIWLRGNAWQNPHQLLVQLAHRLRHHADVADDGHEIRVAGPAGDDVLVEVAGDAGAGAAAEVGAEVKTLRGEGALEQPEDARRLLSEVELLGVGQLFEVRLVGARSD